MYHKPSAVLFELKNFALSQSVSGGELLPLACSGAAGECDMTLGVECLCPNFVEISFLVPGVNCTDIQNGDDCSITPSCSGRQSTAEQCSEGCVVHVTCTANCNGIDFTASCPGFENCSTEVAAATGC